MAYTFTTLTSDTFDYANQVPLKTSIWKAIDGPPDGDQLQVYNDYCTVTLGNTDVGQSENIAVDWADYPDQFISVKLFHLVLNAAIYLLIREGTSGYGDPCYRLALSGPFNPSAADALWQMDQINSEGNGITYTFQPATNIKLKQNDVVLFGVKGTTLFFYLNGSQVASFDATKSPIVLTGGSIGMEMGTTVPAGSGGPSLTDVCVKDFLGGSVS